MSSYKNKVNVCFILTLCRIIVMSRGQDSEELMRKINPIRLVPDEKMFIHSVNDSRMVTCIGNDVRWKSVNDTYVDSYDKKQRIHVEDLSSPSTENQHLRLIFREIYEMDHGDWTCIGINEEKSFSMYVYVPSEFVSVEQSIVVDEFEDIKISCEAKGRPTPEIHWIFNGIRISDSIESSNSRKFILLPDGLYIRNVTKEDSGDYICKAFQISSKVSDLKEQIIQLDVRFTPEILFTKRSLLNGKLNSSTGIFTKYSIINDYIYLTCEAKGNPLPHFSWYHDGKKVSHNVSIGENISVLSLHLKYNKTFGDYKCKAKNALGHDELKIQIKEGERPKIPVKLMLIGRGNNNFDIDVGSSQEDLQINPFAVTHYRFEMITKDDFENNERTWKNHNIRDVEAGNNIVYSINKLSPNTTYLVRVASINVVGLSNWTEAKEFTTLLLAPVKSISNSNCSRNLPKHEISIFNTFFYLFFLKLVKIFFM